MLVTLRLCVVVCIGMGRVEYFNLYTSDKIKKKMRIIKPDVNFTELNFLLENCITLLVKDWKAWLERYLEMWVRN